MLGSKARASGAAHARDVGETVPTGAESEGMNVDMPTSRIRFCEGALNFWVALHEADADRANEESAECDRLVDYWSSRGRAQEFLEPMLHDADPKVQFAAASCLLSHGGGDMAIPVLEKLQTESTMIGPTAWLRLSNWRRDAR